MVKKSNRQHFIGSVSEDYIIAYVDKEGKFINMKMHGDYRIGVEAETMFNQGFNVLGISGEALLEVAKNLARKGEATTLQFHYRYKGQELQCLIYIEPADSSWKAKGAIVKSKIHRLIQTDNKMS